MVNYAKHVKNVKVFAFLDFYLQTNLFTFFCPMPFPIGFHRTVMPESGARIGNRRRQSLRKTVIGVVFTLHCRKKHNGMR
jgi:hypothetical protein